jgi:hypothetical protein
MSQASQTIRHSEMRREISLNDVGKFLETVSGKMPAARLYELDNIIRDEHNTYYWVYPSYKAKKDRWQFRIGFDDDDSICSISYRPLSSTAAEKQLEITFIM